MTSMHPVNFAFILVFIGISVLCVVVIAGYLAHRSAIKKNMEAGIPGPATLFTPFLWLLAAAIVFSFGLMAGSDPMILASGFGNVLFLNLLALVLMIPCIVLAWIGASGVFAALGHLSGGSGSFRNTLQNTGYGLAPGLVLYGLLLLLGALVLTALQIPVTPFGNPVPGNPLVVMFRTGGFLIALLWSFILVTHGLRYSQKISMGMAAVCAGVPVLVFAIFANLQYLAPA